MCVKPKKFNWKWFGEIGGNRTLHVLLKNIVKPLCLINCCLLFLDFKSQPEPSPVLSQLSQRQQHQSQAVTVPPPGLESFPAQAKLRESTPGDSPSTVNKLLQLPSMTIENISVSVHQPQPKHIKLAKRRIPPASKVGISSWSHRPKAGIIFTFSSSGILSFGNWGTVFFKHIAYWLHNKDMAISEWPD